MFPKRCALCGYLFLVWIDGQPLSISATYTTRNTLFQAHLSDTLVPAVVIFIQIDPWTSVKASCACTPPLASLHGPLVLPRPVTSPSRQV